jgi:hypothetical protein
MSSGRVLRDRLRLQSLRGKSARPEACSAAQPNEPERAGKSNEPERRGKPSEPEPSGRPDEPEHGRQAERARGR